jgi:hypothetical protein
MVSVPPQGQGVSNLDAPTVTALVDAAHAHKMFAVAYVETLDDVNVAIVGAVDGPPARVICGRRSRKCTSAHSGSA